MKLTTHNHSHSRLLARQNDCRTDCSNEKPSCNCTFGEQCVIINRDCNTCSYAKCIPADSSNGSSSGGVSKGAVAAAVIVSLLFVGCVAGAYWWYRRRQRLRAAGPQETKVPDVPARAEDVLNRPDPNEKIAAPEPAHTHFKVYNQMSSGTLNLDPASSSYASVGHSGNGSHANPFEDNQSIRTTSTGAQSNVIPIALVPPGSVAHSTASNTSHSDIAGSAHGTNQPERHNAPNDNRGGNLSVANNRASYMSTGTYASDYIESSVIVTPVKQVVGVVKAEVVRAPSMSRSNGRSPLASSSFGPSDVMREEDEQELTVPANPFSDSNSPYGNLSPTPSATTFGPESRDSMDSRADTRQEGSWLEQDPAHLYGPSNDERPSSVYTQASAIVANISSATRVHLGYDAAVPMPQTPNSVALSTPRSFHRMTSAKLVSPMNNPTAAIATGTSHVGLELQQRRALQELDHSKRMSFTSVMSTDTRADSILESFPFVPPSPISMRTPPRTPPRSPLNQHSFGNPQEDTSARGRVERARASASSNASAASAAAAMSTLPPPPNRALLGHASMASQSSGMSTGLDSFDFQIDTGSDESTAPTSFKNVGGNGNGDPAARKRASLDTLALTSDLSSYPLGFDKSPVPPMPRR